MIRLQFPTHKTLVLGCAALLIPGGLLFAGSRHGSAFSGGSFSGHGGILHRIAEKLDLSDEQKSGIREVFKAHRSELRAEMEKLRAARQEEMAAIHGDSFDEGAIRAAAAKVADSAADLAVTRGKIASEMRALLTPEQRVKAKELLSDAQALRGEIFDRIRHRIGEGHSGEDN